MGCRYHPEKRRFATEEVAALWVHRYRFMRGWYRYTYRCDPYWGGCGWLHLTSVPPEHHTEIMIRKAEES